MFRFPESSPGLPNGKKYEVVESELNDISLSSIFGPFQSIANFVFKKFIKSFVADMEVEDKLFHSMFQNILHKRCFEGLNVEKSNLDLILKLPINYKELEVTMSPERPSCVKIQITDYEHKRLQTNQQCIESYREMAKWFDDDKFFVPAKFRFWFQSVVKKTVDLNRYSKDFQVDYSTSGSAITLRLVDVLGTFRVDFVPVLRMDHRFPPPEITELHIQTPNNYPGQILDLSWYVVPKPVNTSDNTHGRVNLNWRLAFYEHEKVLISKIDKLEPALRLLKKFRNSQNLPKIADYYLKTVCLWKLNYYRWCVKSETWEKGSLSYLFVYILTDFYKLLKVGEIPYYWQKEHNLLSDIKQSTIVDMINQLKKIIDKIEADPKLIPQFILSAEEYEQYKYEKTDQYKNANWEEKFQYEDYKYRQALGLEPCQDWSRNKFKK